MDFRVGCDHNPLTHSPIDQIILAKRTWEALTHYPKFSGHMDLGVGSIPTWANHRVTAASPMIVDLVAPSLEIPLNMGCVQTDKPVGIAVTRNHINN